MNNISSPLQYFTKDHAVSMTLRDYFAAKALQNFRDQIGSQSDQEWFDKMAKGAYRVADAMMKAREA
jgi:hypothetical protein